MSQPWSLVHDVLDNWGWGWQNVEARINTNPLVWTVRIQILERFLAKVAAMVGIEINYKWEFVTFCDSNHAAIQPLNTISSFFGNGPCGENSRTIQFDILIGSDGSASGVRKEAKINYSKLETFTTLFPKENKTLPGIQQVTLIANFDPWKSNNGKCPDLAVDQYGDVLSPWYPSFHVVGVNSVWKRFYFGHCQLQILFHNSLGSKVWDNYLTHKRGFNPDDLDSLGWEEDAIPWDIFLKTINVLVKYPYKNRNALQRDLLRKANGEYDVQLFPVTIRKANPLTKFLVEDKKKEEKGERGGILVLVGDSAVTAHYRLGIGINNAFSSFHEVGRLVEKFGTIPKKCWGEHKDAEICGDMIRQFAMGRENEAQIRVEKLVNFQLAAMYYESYCDFVVSYNTEANMNESLEIFRRDNRKRRFDEIFDEDLIRYCK